jgi:hypothetical protein
MKRPLTISLLSALILSALVPSMSLAASGPQSDGNLRYASARLERDIDMLQRDNRDYDGHRAQAVEDLQDSRNQIAVALSYDRRHDGYPAAPAADVNAYGGNRSDANLLYVRQDVEQVIDMLQRDNTDYGGHRVDAIGLMQQGREQLDAALRADRGR